MIPGEKTQAVVSLLAKGSSLQRAAEKTSTPYDQVCRIAKEYGYPDMGKLTLAAEALRAGNTPVKPVSSDNHIGYVLELLHEIARIDDKSLAGRADRLADDLAGLLDEWRDWQAHSEERRKAAEARRLLEERRAWLRAELGALDEQLGPDAADPSELTKAERAEIRLWAAGAGVDCPTAGVIPKRVLKAWRER